ncbi:MAG TPA: response regulator transcription factor [Candidatus Dormibacteraeota bacterium]|jgi:DNA-binding response OmpR family regulator
MASKRDLILVVDDDPKIVALVSAYLSRAGFDVASAGDGRTALRLIHERRPRLVVLDLMLPELDGIDVTREARRESDVPILMLTARGALADRLRGLGEGADDYLAKPFAPSEVVARVQAILRRVPPDERVLRLGDLVVDVDRCEVLRDGVRLDLSPLEFRLLAALLEADGRVLTRDRLLTVLGGPHSDGVMERSVDVYIGRLRSKLGDDPERPRYVATVRGIGYRAAGAR